MARSGFNIRRHAYPNRSADRSDAIARAHAHFDDGDFVETLRRRVAIPSSSQEPERAEAMQAYLRDEMVPALAAARLHAAACSTIRTAKARRSWWPSGSRTRHCLTVLVYGHGDTVRGLDDLWRPGLAPWTLNVEGERIYGRGTADNKGQHSINIAALAAVLAERGRLGFNVKFLIEMGEEVGSAGLRELCEQHKDGALRADLLIASDGPRIAPDKPTLFLGARGGHPIDLIVDLREGGHHSGNWGGLISPMPASCWRRRSPASPTRAARSRCRNGGRRCRRRSARCSRRRGRRRQRRPDDRPRLGRARPDAGRARVRLEQFRGPGLHHRHAGASGQRHPRQAHGRTASCATSSTPGRTTSSRRCAAISTATAFTRSKYAPAARASSTPAGSIPTIPGSRGWRARSSSTCGTPPTILPNLGASLPNDIFIDVLGLKTIWIPHSYAGCSQHAPDEHLLAPIAREGLGLMAGLFWDLGEPGTPYRR